MLLSRYQNYEKFKKQKCYDELDRASYLNEMKKRIQGDYLKFEHQNHSLNFLTIQGLEGVHVSPLLQQIKKTEIAIQGQQQNKKGSSSSYTKLLKFSTLFYFPLESNHSTNPILPTS